MSTKSYSQELLQKEFATRVARNKNYSLRAFARDLELAPSTVSEIMSGKYKLSDERLAEIYKKITARRSSEGLPAIPFPEETSRPEGTILN